MTVPSADAQEEMLRAGLADAGHRASGGSVRRGARHRHPGRRPHRGRARSGRCFGRPHGEPLPDRLGQDEHRAPRGGRGRRRADQGRAGPAPRPDPAQPELRGTRTRTSTSTRSRCGSSPSWSPGRPDGAPRTAAVNSFGFGGANANAVLQEAPRGEAAGVSTPAQIGPYLCRSPARSPEALGRAGQRSTSSVCRAPTRTPTSRSVEPLRAVAHITTCGSRSSRKPPRRLRGARRVVAGQRSPSAATGRRKSAGPPARVRLLRDGPAVVGDGARSSLAEEPVFAKALEQCDETLRAARGLVAARGAPARRGRFPDGQGRCGPGHQRGHPDRARRPLGELGNHPGRGRRAQRRRDRGRTRRRSPDARGHDAPRLPPKPAPGRRPPARARCSPPGSRRRKRRRCSEISTEPSRWRPSTLRSSVTLSGDPDELERLRASLEERGTFARLLPVDVPYHSPRWTRFRTSCSRRWSPCARAMPRCRSSRS